ncbi:MAG: RNA polymerase sigma factor [Amphiplicatus sp.]
MAVGDESDETLVARAGRGDRAAASTLVLRHTDRIFAASWRMLGERAAAEDATQETFLRLWRHAARWRPGAAKFETWLYKVAMNICLDKLRKRGREAPEEAAPERADEAARADDALIAEERRRAVGEAMARLSERQRLAVTLCNFEERSNIEAAEIMGVSIEALESLLARGRRALRDMLLSRREELMEGDRHDASTFAR